VAGYGSNLDSLAVVAATVAALAPYDDAQVHVQRLSFPSFLRMI
jgi:hypothetical protein